MVGTGGLGWQVGQVGGALELSVVNPAGIFGPVLGADFSSSIELITRLMKGMPGCRASTSELSMSATWRTCTCVP